METETEYEKRRLAAIPAKALTFLRVAATKVEIRAALFAVGYSVAEQALGWDLLHQASGHVPEIGSGEDDQAARAAIAELDAWDEPGFRRISAALGRLHPAQHAFVFAGLEPVRGAGAVLSVSTLLNRLDHLESSSERVATRTEDETALATLASRGITAGERKRLRELVTVAETAAPPVLPVSAEEHDAALASLSAWYTDWSETARAVIRRRDYLVMLGLSRRKSRKAGDAEPDDAPDSDADGNGGDNAVPNAPASGGSTVVSSGIAAA